MGENEQSGMLRNVVVLGLIALIAGVVMALVIGLKTEMVDHVDEATPPSVILNMLEPDEFTFDQHHGDSVLIPVPANTHWWNNSQTVLHFDTTSLKGPSWVRSVSKAHQVPAGSKRVKFEVEVKGHTSHNVSPYITVRNKSGKDAIHDGISTQGQLSDDHYTFVSKTWNLADDAKDFYFTLETREDSVVEYKNATFTFYNH